MSRKEPPSPQLGLYDINIMIMAVIMMTIMITMFTTKMIPITGKINNELTTTLKDLEN